MNNENLLERYNCGPVKLTGNSDALYERHLTFDQVIPNDQATARDKFEAIARSVRDVLSQRWLKTEQTYRQRNTKRVYYLSLEYLTGRFLLHDILNLGAYDASMQMQHCLRPYAQPLFLNDRA